MTETFARVVCGVDASDAGTIAARLAARITLPEGSLTLVSVDDPSIAVHAGWRMAPIAEQLALEAKAAIELGVAEAAPIHGVQTRLLEGDPLHCLLAEIARQDATLVVVGTHGRSRAVGIALGSVATHVLHEAPCSVLVARPPREEPWPHAIAVGLDGSPESAEAAAEARRLAGRFGSALRLVAATGEPNIDLDAAYEIAPELEELPGGAVDELHVVSEDAELVVVGSRALKGLRSLGSISERIAHEALCSVLVVRQPKEA
jgi:nucleotide-binding universal stress UspA family protein